MDLVMCIYEVTRNFPGDERFGLTSQLRRAAVSIPSNIAEGHERHTTREYILGLSNAQGSAAEVETQLLIAIKLGYCSEAQGQLPFSLICEIRKILASLRLKLERR